MGLLAAVGVVMAAHAFDDDAPRQLASERAHREHERAAPDTDLLAARRAADEFLPGYLRYAYGQPGGSLENIRAISDALREELRAAGSPRVTPAQQQQTQQVTELAVYRVGPTRATAAATAQIQTSPDSMYPLSFQLERTAGAGWRVTKLRAR